MPRLRSPRGVVVNVPEARAATLTGYTSADKAPAKKAATPRKKADESADDE